WSKSQKAADNSLLKYTTSFNEADYNNFLEQLKIPLGDKQAREQLEKKEPDLTMVSQGFKNGGNNPGDFGDMIFLYRQFRHVSYMDKAIGFWTQGDDNIAKLMKIGAQIH